MTPEVWLAILGTVTALVTAQIKTVQWFMKRLEVRDEQLQKRDEKIDRLIESLSESVAQFKVFEDEEERVHSAILSGLAKLADSMSELSRQLQQSH